MVVGIKEIIFVNDETDGIPVRMKSRFLEALYRGVFQPKYKTSFKLDGYWDLKPYWKVKPA